MPRRWIGSMPSEITSGCTSAIAAICCYRRLRGSKVASILRASSASTVRQSCAGTASGVSATKVSAYGPSSSTTARRYGSGALTCARSRPWPVADAVTLEAKGAACDALRFEDGRGTARLPKKSAAAVFARHLFGDLAVHARLRLLVALALRGRGGDAAGAHFVHVASRARRAVNPAFELRLARLAREIEVGILDADGLGGGRSRESRGGRKDGGGQGGGVPHKISSLSVASRSRSGLLEGPATPAQNRRLRAGFLPLSIVIVERPTSDSPTGRTT